ncbi:hypothetical protein TEA_018651 [Camellia sinensis var. sinensis]|uniref:MADS-box domain-containing protein n=1 Tax=Camellia sinensis var. sinensis TaxID=542762 RepID=A0A4S4DL18_CAMSN|nr:hypothetical protein TEA_018651 [Camellia sinensis var. sinensis]
MTGNKIKLEWIVNDSSRKSTLKRRRAGIFKKAGDLSTLCDVEIGVLVYSQDEDDLAVWPSYGHMKQMFERFLSIPIVERSEKMTTYEGLLTQRVTQETHKNNMEKKNNDKKEIQEIMNQIFEGDKLMQLEERERARRQHALRSTDTLAPAPRPRMIEVDEAFQAHTSTEATCIEQLMNDNWFIETMALNQDMPGPSGVSDMGMPSGSVVDRMNGDNEEDLPEDLNAFFPHIYSP